MLIDKPCCDFQKCKHHFDGNCMNKIEYGRCPYNRQKAEIENLKHNLKCVKDHKEGLIERLQKNLDDKCDKCIARDRAEAIKEFAERLKEKATSTFYEEHKYVDTEAIDDLVKEMTEVNENG